MIQGRRGSAPAGAGYFYNAIKVAKSASRQRTAQRVSHIRKIESCRAEKRWTSPYPLLLSAPVSEGKICTSVSAVPIPRFRRGGERGSAPLPHSEPPYPRLLRNYLIAYFAGSEADPGEARRAAFLVLFAALQKEPAPEGGTIPFIRGRRGSAPAGAGYFRFAESRQRHCGPPTFGWLRSRRKKIGCFATGLRYGAGGRNCISSSPKNHLRVKPAFHTIRCETVLFPP